MRKRFLTRGRVGLLLGVFLWGCGGSAPIPPNRAPQISSKTPAADNTHDPARTAGTTYSVTATDPDGDPLSYQWKWDGANIAGAAGSGYDWNTPRNDGYVGQYALSCVVTDGRGDSATASWTVDVTPGPAKWLVMLYSEGDSNLDLHMLFNLLRIETLLPFSYDVRVTCEVNSALLGNTLRDINGPTAWTTTDLGANIDGSQGAALVNFVDWSVTQTQADQYALVLINHGGQFGGLLQDETSGGGLMDLTTLQVALDQIKANLGQKLDVLGFEMCLMGGVEVADAVQDKANYMVASEEIGWFQINPDPVANQVGDWDDLAWLSALVASPDMTTVQLCTEIVDAEDGYQAAIVGKGTQTLSVVDLSKVPALVSATESFAQALMSEAPDFASNYPAYFVARESTEKFGANIDASGGSTDNPARYVDLEHFASLIQADAGFSTTLRDAAAAVVAANNAAVIYNKVGPKHANAQGLSIFLPENYTVSAVMGYDAANVQMLAAGHAPTWLAFVSTAPGVDTTPPTIFLTNVTNEFWANETQPFSCDVNIPDPDRARLAVDLWLYRDLTTYYWLGQLGTESFPNAVEPFSWAGVCAALTDGTNVIQAPVFEVDAGSSLLAMEAYYRPQGEVTDTYVVLLIDATAFPATVLGAIISVEDANGNPVSSFVDLAPGELWPIWRVYDLVLEEWTLEKSSTSLTVGSSGVADLSLVGMSLVPGAGADTYTLIFSATDFHGNTGSVLQNVTLSAP